MAINKYLDLITSQFRQKPKFVEWTSAPLTMIDSIEQLDIIGAYDLDKAIGKQLNVLGEIIGRSREVNFQPTDGSSPILNDDLYRLILKTKIAINQWDGTLEALLSIWSNLLPQLQLYIKDNQDMSMTAMVVGISSQMEKDLIQNGYIIPKPQGVKLNYEFADVLDLNIYYGFAMHEGIFDTIAQLS